jgi:hypothetical protein
VPALAGSGKSKPVIRRFIRYLSPVQKDCSPRQAAGVVFAAQG